MTQAPGFDIAVIVSTFNRGGGLRATLDSLAAQQLPGLRVQLLIVDNNSSDDTGAVIARFAAGRPHVGHLFEARQGVSHGRNAALAVMQAPIVAFTDDDVVVPPDWLAAILRSFERHPDVDYVSGRILPTWLAPPPAWMATASNGPCALRDGGCEPRRSSPGVFFPGWATANIAFRRSVFDRLGGFNGDFRRGQDLELILRVWRAGSRGLYAPDVVVSHAIHPERMIKAYHRQWHAWQGAIRSRLRFREIFDGGDRILDVPRPGPTLFGVPAHLYRALVGEAGHWLGAVLQRDAAGAFAWECRARQTVSYIRTRAVTPALSGTPSIGAELLSLARALRRRHVLGEST